MTYPHETARSHKVKIAIPTNDGKNIFPKILGCAKEIYIYEIKNKKIRFIEKKRNPYENTLQHLKTIDIYELISDGDCNIIVSNKIGKKGIKRLEEKGMVLFFENKEIKNALSVLSKRGVNNETTDDL